MSLVECLQVRVKMVGEMEPTYSEYTCYTGIAGGRGGAISEGHVAGWLRSL